MKIPLGKGRNLSIDKTGAMYQTNRPGGRNLYSTKGSNFRIVKGGRNPEANSEALAKKKNCKCGKKPCEC